MQAIWLEDHDQFEGIGAHPENPRFTWIPEDAVAAGFDAIIDTSYNVDEMAGLKRRAILLELAATIPIRLDGPDVSHYQYDYSEIDWVTVLSIPTIWAATKLTQSTSYFDPTAAKSRRGMQQRYRGLYHWVSSSTDPYSQAQWFLKNLGKLAVGEFAMLDCEEAGVTVAKILVVAEVIEAVTQRPCAIYTGAFVAGGTIWRSSDIRNSKYGKRPMILAAYTSEARAKTICEFAIHPWHSWQYSSNGPVAGITGRCDMNRVDDTTIYDLACGFGIIVEPKPPVETPPVAQPNPNPPVIIPGADTMFVKFTIEGGAATWYGIAQPKGNGQLKVAFCWWPGRGDDPTVQDYMAGMEGNLPGLNPSPGQDGMNNLGQISADTARRFFIAIGTLPGPGVDGQRPEGWSSQAGVHFKAVIGAG